jgi:hypothetical protein
MLEVYMSVWSETWPTVPSLSGREGELISISIAVDPRCLELLLEALAQAGFPINPQIYHNAAMVYRYADGREESEPATLVEFPAYGGQLDAVRRALKNCRFDPASLQVTGMLDQIHAECRPEPAPAGADYVARYRLKPQAGMKPQAGNRCQTRSA